LKSDLALIFWLIVLGFWRSLNTLLPKRKSQNVIAVLKTGKPKNRIAVTAHYDSAICTPNYKLRLFARLAFTPMLVFATFVLISEVLGIFSRLLFALVFLPFCVCLYTSASGKQVSPGAYDNASGVAVMLETARVLAESPPEETELLFIALGAKEQELVGARELVKRRVLTKGTRVLNFDGLGLGARTCVIEGSGVFRKVRTPSELNRVLAGSIENAKLKPKFEWAVLAKHDHIPFVRAGLQATTLTTGIGGEDKLGRLIGKAFGLPNARIRGYRYLHTLEDTPERIDLLKVEQVGFVVIEFIKNITMSETVPVALKKNC
jgi:Zn-dependent M28 family amino/carboxypeptidase